MVYVFLTLAIGLSIAAWKTDERTTRYWFLACAILNAVGAAKAIITDDPWAFKLRPNTGYEEPYTPDRRR